MLFSEDERKEIWNDIMKTIVVCALMVSIPLVLLKLLTLIFN